MMMSRKLCARKIDELGRIVLPMEARQELGVEEKQIFDIFLEKGSIILKPNREIPSCKLCGQDNTKLFEVGDSFVCMDCVAKICLANIQSN